MDGFFHFQQAHAQIFQNLCVEVILILDNSKVAISFYF
jgi:hypothetical protein